MPKRKRSRSRSDDRYDTILKKVKKLEKMLKKKPHRRRNSTSSLESGTDNPVFVGENSVVIDSDDGNMGNDYLPAQVESPPLHPPLTPAPLPEGPQRSPSPPSRSPPPLLPSPARHSHSPTLPPLQPVPGTSSTVDPGSNDLQSKLLNLMGPDPNDKKSFSEKLHKDIASRWTHIVLNGLPKDQRSDLTKEYLFPENCTSLIAPKLNAEVKSGLSDSDVKHDEYSENKQNQLGNGLAALGHVLNWALTSHDIVPPEIIKKLSDAGRIFCDSHHRESLSRRYAITNVINKNIKDIIKDTKIDNYLFGSNLSEHIKCTKAINKTGLEIKQTPRLPYRPFSAVQFQRGALNFRGGQRMAAPGPRPAPTARQPPVPPIAPPRDRRQPAPRGRQRSARYQSKRR